jgi:hypothetical protein
MKDTNSYKKRSIFDTQSGGRPIVLKNKTCIYCGIQLDKQSTREHVIGRNFVPNSKWSIDWNLIAQSCQSCNFHKSKLEDDISAITLQIHSNEPSLKDLVHRKSSKSKSAKTGKNISSSTEHTTIKFPIAPEIQFTFKMQAPPQMEDRRAFELARLHMSAFFYMITYDESQRLGKFWEGYFSPIACKHKGDWGNITKKAFMNYVVEWDDRFIGVTAGGFFKVILKRHPTENCFAWSLEWNQSHRVYGFFGDRTLAENIFGNFPEVKRDILPVKKDEYYALSLDVVLLEEDDTMFVSRIES